MTDKAHNDAAPEPNNAPNNASMQAPVIALIGFAPKQARSISAHLAEHLGTVTNAVQSPDCIDDNTLDRTDAAICVCPAQRGAYRTEDARSLLGRKDTMPVVLAVEPPVLVPEALHAVRGFASDVVTIDERLAPLAPIVVEKALRSAETTRLNMALQAALASSLATLKQRNMELEHTTARFREMATTDELTGLDNRRRLTERLETAFDESKRYNVTLTALMIDLDRFKAVNDQMGHHVGDALLRLTGRVIDEQVRLSDIAARYGGDEFVVVLPHTEPGVAIKLGERLIHSFRRRSHEIVGPTSTCDMSVGIASTATSNPANADELLQHADAALYHAKKKANAPCALYDDSINPLCNDQNKNNDPRAVAGDEPSTETAETANPAENDGNAAA